MYLRDLWNSCVRRWYVLLACLLVTAGLLFGASTVVKPSYEATSSLVLVPPPNPESPKLNRYLDLGGLTDAVAVLANSMTSEALQKSFADRVEGGTYEVSPDVTTSAPIVIVTAKAHTGADADRLLDLVLAQVPGNLTQLQATLGITARSQITVVSVSADPAKRVEKTRLRLLGALGVALLLGSALVVGLVDGLLLRRPRASGGMALHALDPEIEDDASDDELPAGRAMQNGRSGRAPDQASARAPARQSSQAARRRRTRRGKAVGSSSASPPGLR